MGVEGSKDGQGHLGRGIPSLARRNILSRWQKRELSSQIFVVARHDERADGAYAMINGTRWTQTDDFMKWPLDPPLSDAGIESAGDTARRLQELADCSGCQIHVIITSPYYRCVQTAVEFSRGLGHKPRLLIDRSLGEVYGPQIMGPTQPQCPARPLEHIQAYCKARGVSSHPKVVGKWPNWPEDLKEGRRRYANRFLVYLHRANVSKRNFILVTHADCVAASLSMMPSQANHAVDMVDYGGLFCAKRERRDIKTKAKASVGSTRRSQSLVSVLPSGEDSGDAPLELDAVDDDEHVNCFLPKTDMSQKKGSWTPMQEDGWLKEITPRCGKTSDLFDAAEEEVELPQASDGWNVFTHDVKLRQKAQSRPSTFSKKVKTLTKGSKFSQEHIEKLLGELSDKPLGNGEQETSVGTRVADPGYGHSLQSIPTCLSFSTFLFGASDVANLSDCGSDIHRTFTDELVNKGSTDNDFDQILDAYERHTKRISSRRSDSSRDSRDMATHRSRRRSSPRTTSNGKPIRRIVASATQPPYLTDRASSPYDHSGTSPMTPKILSPGHSRVPTFVLEKVDEKECPDTTTDAVATGPTLTINSDVGAKQADKPLNFNDFGTSTLMQRRLEAKQAAKQAAKQIIFDEKNLPADNDKNHVPFQSFDNSSLLQRRQMRLSLAGNAPPPSPGTEDSREVGQIAFKVRPNLVIDAKQITEESGDKMTPADQAVQRIEGKQVCSQQGEDQPAEIRRPVVRHMSY